MLKNRDFTSLMTVPTILEDIVLMESSGSAAAELARLDFVVVGGGGIKASVGSALQSNGVTLLNHFGATELGALAPIFRPDKSYDWRYLKLRGDMGLQLKRLKPQDDADTAHMLIGHQFGSNSVFELQDSLEVNPLKPGAEVKILGRNDDLLVLATGEKVSPSAMENLMEQEPLIKRAILFGTGRFEVGMLIEPVSNVAGRERAFIDAIWPTVAKANETVDQHACISSKAAILIKPSDKQIPLSDKGSPQRKEVYSVFASEIQSIYEKLDKEGSNTAALPIDPKDLSKSIRAMVQMSLPTHNKPNAWSDDDDFIRLGMDSVRT
jgi:acyl-CoA synthetase (AMP-forming)/AMP-acid ligase II